jgi:hypothetical protein
MASPGFKWRRINSSQLREALQSNVLDLEPSGILFMYLHEFLDVHFDRYIVSNVPRSCNSSAHERLPILV